MGQILGPDIIQKPTQTGGSTIVVFPGTNVVTVGAQQFIYQSPQINIGIVGLGGLDAPLVNFNDYNVFAVPGGFIASIEDAPAGYSAYTKVGLFFVTISGIILYQIAVDDKDAVALVNDSGNKTAGTITSDTYMQINCGVSIGRGFWDIYSYVQTGNTGGSHRQVFLQTRFGDTDGTNAGAPPSAIIAPLITSGNISQVTGQFAPSTSGSSFNSMGLNHRITVNAPSPIQVFQSPRLQAINPGFSTCSAFIYARRLGDNF